MALVQHHTDSSMKCKKTSVSAWCVFSNETDQTASAQILFFYIFFNCLFFLFVSRCIFHFASVDFCPVLELGWGELSSRRSAAGFAEVSLLSIDSAARKLHPCILMGSTAVGRQKGGRGKELKACTGQIHQQTNQAAGASIMMPPVNCSWLEAHFTAQYQSLCILLTLFHWIEPVQLYGASSLHQFEINP